VDLRAGREVAASAFDATIELAVRASRR